LIFKIQNLLEDIGLKLSADKTSPLIRTNLIKSISEKFPDLTKKQVDALINTIYEDQLKCPKVGKYDTLPCSTSLIDKLSQLGEQQVKAMNKEELTNYISELLELLNTGFAEEEIRDDTKTSFAAWRLRKAVKDARYFDLHIKSNVTETLLRAFMKYPYKLTLVQCYVIHLMELLSMGIDEASSRRLLIDVLKNSRKTNDVKLPGYYGAYIRTYILFTIAENWGKIPEKSRSKLKKAIANQINKWYRNTSPYWHEEYAVYWLYVNLNIREAQSLWESDMPFVARARQLFQLSNHNYSAGEDPVLIASLCDIWRKNRSNIDSENQKKAIPEGESQWTKWVWNKIEKWDWSKRGNERVWTELSRGREKYISTFGFTKLIELCERQLNNFYNELELPQIDEWLPKFNGIIEILNEAISIWVSRTDQDFNSRFTEAIFHVSDENRVKKYLERRLNNLILILGNYFPERHSLPKRRENQRKEVIPLQDWIEIIIHSAEANGDVKTPKDLLPLTELEITSLLVHVGKEIKRILGERTGINRFFFDYFTYFTLASFNRIGFSIENWEKWRNDPNSCGFKFTQNNVVFSESELSAWYYTKAKFLDENRILSHAYAVLLLKLISRKMIKSGTTGITRLKGWKKIGDIMSQAEFPSTTIAELIAGELNYQRPFYVSITSENVPLFPLEKTPVQSFDEFLERLEMHLNILQKRLFIGSTGLREMRYIDLDKLTE